MPCLTRLALTRGTSSPGELLVEEARKYSPILVRGFSTGNISVVDKQSWLEVCDEKHRYGANLQAYYKVWKRYDGPKPAFWEWLDDESVEVEGVPRTKLESETVLYYNKAEREKFALGIHDGLVITKWNLEPITTAEEGWIFVLRDGILYGSEKITNQAPRIHHTSLVGGECVQAAGMIVVNQGILQVMYPHSGHYRPSESEVLVLLRYLQDNGIALADVQVDVQRIQKLSREIINGKKIKKLANAHFWSGDRVLYFLAAKELACQLDLFHALEMKYLERFKDVSI